MPTKPPSAKTARDAILSRGKAIYPTGLIGPDELLCLGARPYPTRIGELREAGWDWEAVYDGIDPRPSYRLRSLTRGTADPVEWGLRARLGASTGLVVTPYGTSTLVLPEGVEARILARVRAVIKEELAKVGSVHGMHTEPVEPLEPVEDLEEYEPPEGWTGDIIDDDDE